MSSSNTPPLASPKSPHAVLRETALTKARVYWVTPRNGTAQVDYYSFDRSGRYEVADPREYGIRQLKKLVDKLGAAVARCIIYDRQNGGEVCRKENGVWSN